jgi:acyl-CoA synthetase (AMP-forming)/AMP-acid ligase II
MSSSIPPVQPLGNAAQMLLATAAADPAGPAVIDGDATTRYSELAARSLGIARTLQAVAAFFGVLACGAIAVTVNESLRPRQIEYILGHAGARVLLTSSELTRRLPRPLETSARVLNIDDVLPGDGFQPVARVETDVAHIICTRARPACPRA